MSEIHAGMLLLASPELLDPNFADTVVLLLDADEDGAMGVVLNRPSPVPVISVLAEWGDIVAEPEVLFRGGPVSPDGALAVALVRDPGVVPGGLRPVTDRLAIVDLEGEATDLWRDVMRRQPGELAW